MKKEVTFIAFLFIILLFQGLFGNLFAQEQLTNLPTFYITTDDGQPVTDKSTYKKGTITIKSSILSEELTMITEIRGRGNSTWGMPKKPYRIKLDSKTRILNLPAKAKSWVLLANYADKSLIRNALAFKISELVELEFSPAVRFFDLVLNGEFQGTYMLTDQIEVRENRVPVEEQDGASVAGGYLIEIDGFASGEPNWFSTGKGIPITIKYPDDEAITPDQNAYIREFTQRFEDSLFSSDFKDPENGYRSMVDEHSLINWYIACELTGNSDSFWSTYVYKYRDVDKFYFGPLWDYDIAFNNDNRLGDATQKLMREHAHVHKDWIHRLWQDEWFRNTVDERWTELTEDKDILNKLLNYIQEMKETLDESQKKNFDKWKILNQQVYNETYLFPTYEQGIDYLKEYITNRVNFLTESFASTVADIRPFNPGNSYYAIQNVANQKIISVNNNSLSNNANLVLWSLSETNDSHLWGFVPVGYDSYQIINRKSSLAVTGNSDIGNLTQSTPDVNNKKQHWSFISIGNGAYGIVNSSTSLVIDNTGGGTSNGNSIINWHDQIYSNENQQWFINKIIDNEVGVQNVTVSGKMEVYPNPVLSHESLYIRFSEPLAFDQQDIYLGIYMANGMCVYKDKSTVNERLLKINLNSISICPGLYILRIGDCFAKIVVK